MHRRFPLLALFTVSLVVAGCENKPSQTAPAPAAPAAAKPAPAPAAPAPAAPAAAPAKAEGPGRTVGFELVEASPVGALQFDVQYSGEGRFVGDADAVACETKIEGALSSYNHIVAEKNLRAAYVDVKGFSGPKRIAECKFQGNAKPEDFKVTVRDSSNPDLGAIDPPPTIKVVLD